MSNFWQDKDRRRGAIGSVVVHIILLLIFIFFGLKYYEPKPEDGIVINFGNSATGIGDQADGAPQAAEAPAQPQEAQPEPQQTTNEANESPSLTQDVVDAPALDENRNEKQSEKTEKEEKKQPSPEELERQRLEREREDQRKQLEERFGKVSDSKPGGEGVKDGPGDQGDPSGDPSSNNRQGGSGGGGGGGNYMLGGRKALFKPKPEYQCEEQGRVVVKIYVNRNGKVVQAIPGEKVPNGAATTTTSSCLFDKARAAALRTTWQGDSEAPSQQVGYIIYNFQKR